MYYSYYVKFSGSSIQDRLDFKLFNTFRWAVAFYNIYYTALPIFAIGTFDQDVKDEVAESYPILYRQGHEKRFFNFRVFMGWVINAFYHSFICFIFPVYIFQDRDDALWLGITIYYCVWLVVNIKSILETG
jgi:phospholipid-transporting ATPase